MGIKDILTYEENNESSIYLHKEGLFWRAYEVSAYLFIRNIKDYQIKKKHYKNVGKDIVFLGFPNSVLDDILSKHNVAIEKNGSRTTKGNFYEAIEKQNKIARDHKPTQEEQETFLSSMNSYLGIMEHYKTYKLRKRMIFNNLSAWWWNYVYLSGGVSKFVLRTKRI